MANDLYRLTATEASKLLETRKISSIELVQSCLDRIEAREPTVQAWEHVDPEYVLRAAKTADAKTRAGALHGIPFGVKDVIDTVDAPTTYGSSIFAGRRPAADAPCVRTMKGAGAVMMGKAVSTEFATYRPGKTRNPHNPAHTPGGSSSGPAAAVADMMVPLAFGTQTAGSHIRPGSFCGICAFKPTWGQVDVTGIWPLEYTFDTLGYYARSFDDIELYYSTLRRVPSLPLGPLAKPPRIGWFRTAERKFAEPASVAAVEAAARKLQSMGATVEEFELPSEYAHLDEVHPLILNVGLTRALGSLYGNEKTRSQLSDPLRGMIEKGLATKPADFRAAMEHADRCRRDINAAFGNYDLLLCPSAPGEAPAGTHATGSPIFQIVWTLLHLPCVNVPGAVGPNGLPVGVQLVGRQYDDTRVLQAAKWLHGA